MKNFYSLIFHVLILFWGAIEAKGENTYWGSQGFPGGIPEHERWIKPERFGLMQLDLGEISKLLKTAPEEFSSKSGIIVEIPMPNNSFQRFEVFHSPVMEPGLAAKFPGIDTWRGQGIDNPRAAVAIDITHQGFHAMIVSPEGQVFVDPYAKSNTQWYISYFKKDLKRLDKFQEEGVLESIDQTPILKKSGGVAQRTHGTQLRTYRLALAATYEYTTFHGGTVALALSAMTTSVNRVVQVYRMEFGVNLVLVSNTNLLIYTTTSDPYTNNNGSTMLNENQTNVNSIIGSANYDIGHVFSTGGGGIAALASVCVASTKAMGVTGSSSPVNDAFDIDYVAHEMGHQFGGNHSFNGNTGSCSGGNRNSSTAYEPGSGSTIMAYAGICSPQDLQANSDPYFHTINFDEIVSNITTGSASGCAVVSSSGNTPPLAQRGNSPISIPFGTPFTLTGSGSDADNDSLTYCWEQFNLGASSAPNTPSSTGPRFRSYNPSTSPSRTFPRYDAILTNTVPVGEVLSTAAQNLNFRLTVRDNKALCGGVDYDQNLMVVNVASSGPFALTTAPSIWAVGSTQTVTWSVNNTNTSPVNCSNVDILLSIDDGKTWPYVLASNTPNDGSEVINLPANVTTQTARLQVKPTNNVFFTVSPSSFSIDDPTAGSFVVIGNGTGSNAGTAYPAPYGNYFGGVKHQFIYRASELVAKGLSAGVLSSFGFNVSNLVAGNLLSFSVGMKSSTVNDLTSAWQSGFTTVYSNPAYAAVNGWNMHPLSTPFYWDGSSNILVEVCFNNNNGGTTANTATVLTTGLPTGTSRWYRADNVAALCTSSSVTTAGNTSRPNARLFYTNAPTLSASQLVFNQIANTFIRISWTKGNGGKRLVICRTATTAAVAPTQGQAYLESPSYGMGQQTGLNNFVVYADSGNSVMVTNLQQNTNYAFDIYEYNGSNGVFAYRTTQVLTGTTTTLPVVLTKFSGERINQHNKLGWITQSETNSSHFEVQRKTALEPNFELAGRVEAAGTSQVSKTYRFDEERTDAVAFWIYRLKMVDRDGSFTYSKEISLANPEVKEELVLSPNPSRGSLMLRYPGSVQGELSIYNLEGVKVIQQQITTGSAIQLNGLKGIYLVEIRLEDGYTKQEKVLFVE